MAFPLLAHQGLAAPALLARRRVPVDAVALLIGSIAPDLPSALDRTALDFDSSSHTTLGLFVWCLPVTLLAAVLFRRVVARPVATHLPDLGALRLRDVAHAATDRPWLVVSVVSALLGAWSHLLVDSFTHPEAWAVEWFPWLEDQAPLSLPLPGETTWYDVAHVLADAGGAAMAVIVLCLAARRRDQLGVPRPVLPLPTSESRMAFWGSLTAGTIIGLVMMQLAWGTGAILGETMARGIVVFVWIAAASVVVGSILASRLVRASTPPEVITAPR